MTSSPKNRSPVYRSRKRSGTADRAKPNVKRSRYMKKTDEEIFLDILVVSERAGSFCPEKLMRLGRIGLFEEAYRRFETWDGIVERCVVFSNDQNLTGKRLMPPKEIVLEILRLESCGASLREYVVAATCHELHEAALLFYGSWNRALAIVGLNIRDPPK